MNHTFFKNERADYAIGVTPQNDSYGYIFELHDDDGWIRLDTCQDSARFGIWLNPQARQIFFYTCPHRLLVVSPSIMAYQTFTRLCAKRFNKTKPSHHLQVSSGSGSLLPFPSFASYEPAF